MKLKLLLTTGFIALGGVVAAFGQDTTPTNVLLNKAVIEVAGSPAAANEGPENLIDGNLETKYCIIQSNPYVVIDAQGYFNFESFKFYDCKTNEEEENASAYKLELSVNGQDWQTVAEASDVASIDLKEINLVAPVRARYVRFSPTYNICARMWELEGYGTDASTLSATLKTPSLELEINNEAEIKLTYVLKGEKAEDFAILAEVSSSKVQVGEPIDNAGEVSIPVKGIAKGYAVVTVTVVNGGESYSFEVPVKVNSDAPISDADAVEVTNWTKDIVAEKANETAFDNINDKYWGGYALYTSSVRESGALCDDDGIVETNNGNVYKIPVDRKNAVEVKKYEDPVEILFAKPLTTDKINVLVLAHSEDGVELASTVCYEDNSEGDPVKHTISHYVYTQADGTEAKTELGQIENYFNEISVPEELECRIYEIELPTDPNKTVKGIRFEVGNGYYEDVVNVFGINAKDKKSSGINNIDADNEKEVVAVYNMQGQWVTAPTSGLYIVRYSDGSSVKIIIK